MDKVETLFKRIETAMAAAAVQLEEGEYDSLHEAMDEFTAFSEQINACSRQELKPHMERLESVQEDLRLLLAEMEHHKVLLKDDLDSLKNSSHAAKAYAKSGTFSKRNPEE